MVGSEGPSCPEGRDGSEGNPTVGFGIGLGIPTVGGLGSGELDPGLGKGLCWPPCCPDGLPVGDP